MHFVSLSPSFELAMRRSLFYLLILTAYLGAGALIFPIFKQSASARISPVELERIDLKRAELLNVLWAETVARSENEWHRIANQKMDSYEKVLQTMDATNGRPTNDGTFSGSFQLAFRIVTTIGGVETDELTVPGHIFALIYSLLGIPVALLYLDHCNRMVHAAIGGGWKLIASTFGVIFVGAIAADIVGGRDDDDPFSSDILSSFLLVSTVGEESPKLRGIASYFIALVGLSFASTTFVWIQRKLDRHFQSYEMRFSLFFGEIASWKEKKKEEEAEWSTSDLLAHNRIVEEDEEEEEEEED